MNAGLRGERLRYPLGVFLLSVDPRIFGVGPDHMTFGHFILKHSFVPYRAVRVGCVQSR